MENQITALASAAACKI